MSEGTLQPSGDVLSVSKFDVEFTMQVVSGKKRTAFKLSDFPRISTLRSLFASVVVSDIRCEMRQDTDVSTDDGGLTTKGHLFVAIIPTIKDSDALTGGSEAIVNNVPNKQTFPLSSVTQSNMTFSFRLDGYELDLAQDPRRGAGPVAWIGNSGVSANGKNAVSIATATWRLSVMCSGETPLWQ